MPRPKSRYILAALACALLLVIIVGAAHLTQKNSKSPVTVHLIDIKQRPNGLMARIAVTNISRVALNYHEMRRTAQIHIQTTNQWITNSILMEPILRLPTVLAPGSNDIERIFLPAGAIRFQIRYTIPTSSPRETARLTLSPKWRDRLGPLLNRALSNKPGPVIQASSPLFEILTELTNTPYLKP